MEDLKVPQNKHFSRIQFETGHDSQIMKVIDDLDRLYKQEENNIEHWNKVIIEKDTISKTIVEFVSTIVSFHDFLGWLFTSKKAMNLIPYIERLLENFIIFVKKATGIYPNFSKIAFDGKNLIFVDYLSSNTELKHTDTFEHFLKHTIRIKHIFERVKVNFVVMDFFNVDNLNVGDKVMNVIDTFQKLNIKAFMFQFVSEETFDQLRIKLQNDYHCYFSPYNLYIKGHDTQYGNVIIIDKKTFTYIGLKTVSISNEGDTASVLEVFVKGLKEKLVLVSVRLRKLTDEEKHSQMKTLLNNIPQDCAMFISASNYANKDFTDNHHIPDKTRSNQMNSFYSSGLEILKIRTIDVSHDIEPLLVRVSIEPKSSFSDELAEEYLENAFNEYIKEEADTLNLKFN